MFDFDDTKTLVLLFLIKLFSVSGMNLTPKANLSLRTLRTLKNLSSVLGFDPNRRDSNPYEQNAYRDKMG